jgi:hypothetical protein
MFWGLVWPGIFLSRAKHVKKEILDFSESNKYK